MLKPPPSGRFVVDFLCLRHRLIVEADGDYFHDPVRDAERDAWLTAEGFRVLRFTEGQIRSKPEVVLATIAQAAGRQPARLRRPLIRPAARATFSRRG